MPQYVQQTVEFEAERSRLNEWLVIVLFSVILLTPFVTQLIGFSTDSTTENRVLAPLPKINSLREIKLLPKMSENYVNDRFGLRQQLVHFNSLTRYRLGLSSSKDGGSPRYIASSYSTSLSVWVTSATPNVSSATWSSHSSSVSHRSRSNRIARPPRRGFARTV